jgi:hypothetical protein
MYKGLEVICETAQDLDALASGTSSNGHGRTRKPRTQHKNVKRLVREVGEKQQLLLSLLLKARPSSVTDQQLREGLGLESNKGLAGVFSGLSKQAKGVGIAPDSLILKSASRNGSGDRTYQYALTDEIAAEVEEGLKASRK